jgi:dolichol-phosphate mannosyltransferase
MQTSDSIVIIPTYNEKENIENIIRAVFGLEKCFHILIVEDNSPDGTADIVRKLQAEFPERLFMIERKGKLGLGTAYIAGFKWAIQHQYDYIFEMDADFSHNPNDLPRLYKACHDEGADVAIGSRYISGVNVVNWPMGRVLMSYFASKYVRFITGIPVHDTTAGFKCYKRRVLETIPLDNIRFKGYAFPDSFMHLFGRSFCQTLAQGFDKHQFIIIALERLFHILVDGCSKSSYCIWYPR